MLSFLASAGLVQSIKLAVLLTIKETRNRNIESALARAQTLDPSVTQEEVREGVIDLFSFLLLPVWFHDVLVAGAMVEASEDAIFDLVTRKAAELGKPVSYPQRTRSRIRWFTQYCIKEKKCRLDPTGKYWVVPNEVFSAHLNRLIRDKTSREFGPQVKTGLLRLMRNKIHITAVRAADDLQITVDKAQAEIENVMRIFSQPEWFLDLLLNWNIEGLLYFSPSLQTAVRAKEHETRVGYQGNLKNALKAWISLVAVPMRKANRTNLFTRYTRNIGGREVNFLSIRPELVQKYI
jgi:hypothetical protein